MKIRLRRYIWVLVGMMVSVSVLGVELESDSAASKGTWQVVGSIQHESLFPTVDVSAERTSPRADWAMIDHLSNSYVDVGVRYQAPEEQAPKGLTRSKEQGTTDSLGLKATPPNLGGESIKPNIGFKGVSAAIRGELLEWPLLGYEPDFRGYGLSHVHVETDFKWGTITVGDVYGQFGSGLILRLYEDRFLGVDNALRGGKVELMPYKGIYFEALGGKQRRYWSCYEDKAWGWNYSQDAVMGLNLELEVSQWSQRMQDAGANLTFGGSFVSKYEAFDTIVTEGYYYNLPEYVGAGDVRVNFSMKGWNALVEYAYKANDPSFENGFSYRPGHAFLASLSYSRKGLSLLVQAKRSDNMSFRSKRMGFGLSGNINHMPPFAYQHTYALASLNSYATQKDDEWAFQVEARYAWKRKTAMGGRYGTALRLHASHIRGQNTPYYTDINVELNKRVAKDWYLNAMLMYQQYNQTVVDGHGGMVRSGIGVLDVKWVTSHNVQMRAELQYLFSRDDNGQWIYALYELSLWKHWMLSFSEQYCIGHAATPTDEQGNHYYSALVTWKHGSHRLSAGYVKTLAGYNCSGGVCRFVPEQEGVQITYDFTW